MSLRVKGVAERSPAEKIGIASGDEIFRINGNKINNFLDLQFYGADPKICVEWKSADGILHKKELEIQQSLGVIPEQHRCRECRNNCVFCFVRQLPKGLRPTLYLRDDDFLFSFIYGNFITFSNITSDDIRQIKQQFLSPLYVSVHALDKNVRQKMLRGVGVVDIEPILEELFDSGIRFHFQIVLVPGYNDGDVFAKTLRDLQKFEPESIGVVPVGLTEHRQGLPKLRKLTPLEASQAISTAKNFAGVYCADELFLQAGLPLPDLEYYQDFPQLENGIGLLRKLLCGWQRQREDFEDFAKGLEADLLFVCGESAFEFLRKISLQIKIDTKISSQVVKISNDFFGRSITVSGLLTAADICSQANGENKAVCLSSAVFNTHGITLDGVSKQELKRKLRCKFLVIIDEVFDSWEVL